MGLLVVKVVKVFLKGVWGKIWFIVVGVIKIVLLINIIGIVVSFVGWKNV